MNPNWKQIKWGDICSLEYGKRLNGYKTNEHEFDVYGSAGKIGTSTKYLHEKNGVVISRKGTLDVYYSKNPFYVIDTAFFLKPKTDLFLRWIYYYLKNFDIKSIESGSAIPSLSREDFYNTYLFLPPVSEQQAIAHILGTIDDKIELNQKMNQNLEDIAKAIFKSWFIDYDPVKAKGEGKPTGLPQEISDLFPSSFEDSELGEIPKGWLLKKISDLAQENKLKINPLKYPKERFEYYDIPSFDDGIFPTLVTGSDIKSQKSIVEAEMILVSKLNPGTPRIWIPNPGNELKKISSTEFISLIPKNNVDYSFLYFLFTANRSVLKLSSLVTGTSKSHQRVRKDDIIGFNVIYPSEVIVKRFDNITRPILENIILKKIEINSLSKIRDTLLPKLISGDLRIKDAEKFIEEAGI